MQPPIVAALLPVGIVATAILAGWLTAWHYYPALVEFAYALLEQHHVLVGSWGLLVVVGIDYALVAMRDAVSFSNVGAKARAHLGDRMRRGGY